MTHKAAGEFMNLPITSIGRTINPLHGRSILPSLFGYLGLLAMIPLAMAQEHLDYHNDIAPLLKNYCFDCHADGESKGDFAIDQHKTEAAALADLPFWKHVREAIITEVMPPPKKRKQPTADERTRITDWIDRVVYHIDCSNPDPGRVTIRRLNRREYNYSIQDLFGIDIQPADDFPADDSGYGFDRIGDVLTLSPVLMEKYFNAAEAIVNKAIHRGPLPIPSQSLNTGSFKAQPPEDSDQPPVMSTTLTVTEDGDYTVNVEVRANSFNPWSGELICTVWFNDEQIGHRTYTNSPMLSDIFTLSKTLKKGTYTLAYRLDSRTAKTIGDKTKVKISLGEASFIGPTHRAALPKSHRDIFIKGPATTVRDERLAYARDIFTRYGERAFRRPVDDAFLTRLSTLAVNYSEQLAHTFEDGVALGLQAILVSPRFLFRAETQPHPGDPNVTHELDEWSLASRLSYFLWNSIPDDELLHLAKTNTLRANWDATIKRMVSDRKSQRFLDDFIGQWLQVRDVDSIAIDISEFRDSRNIRQAMREETEMLFKYIAQNNRDVMELLTANYTFLNDTLAKWYDLPAIEGKQMRRVELPADSIRGGILTHGSFLVVTSNPTRTSPVKRGLFVLENILDTPPPPAPADVPELEAAKKNFANGASLRELLEIHREKPMCASCHARMDPIGLGLEQFDLVGRLRDNDDGKPIDPRGQLISGEPFTGVQELRGILGKRHKEFYRCITQKLLTYALGRGLEYYDSCAVNEITNKLLANGGSFSTLLNGVLTSVPFQKRRGDGDIFRSTLPAGPAGEIKP
jgi:Protein of unknown function (DUF1592)/Protein of unknown function (DUF1588)/Protein of unknown function (DUF1587)/Protein of unknown function (DUF1585)/Protein of unknown function (DUF1595)